MFITSPCEQTSLNALRERLFVMTLHERKHCSFAMCRYAVYACSLYSFGAPTETLLACHEDSSTLKIILPHSMTRMQDAMPVSNPLDSVPSQQHNALLSSCALQH